MEVADSDQNSKFELVQLLAKDLSKGGLELPSFPDIVVRIRKAIADESCTTDQIVKIIGAEPVLAARILTIANSAALRPATDAITDLPMAVNRIGRSMVRNTTMSYGMVQSKSAYSLKEAKVCLEKLWDESAHVAALSFVLAKRCTQLNPDEALLVGLMHAIGKLYILARAESHRELFGEDGDLFHIMDEWHAPIGSSILENWGFEPYVSFAVANYRDHQREHEDNADYTDVLTLAYLFSRFVRAEDDTEVKLDQIPASKQLKISTDDVLPIIQDCNDQISSLRQALGK